MSKPASRSRKGAGLTVRLAVLIVLGTAAAAVVMRVRSPVSVGEDEVRGMIERHELNGLPLAEAAKRLQHRAPEVQEGSVVIEFRNVRGWRAGDVVLDVRGGRVVAASFGKGEDVE